MFWTRLLSGIALLLGAILTVRAGGPVLLATVGVLSVLSVFELLKALSLLENRAFSCVALCGSVFYTVIAGTMPEVFLLPAILLVLFGLLAFYVFRYPAYHADEVMGAFFSFFYATIPLLCLYLIREGDNGKILVWLAFLSGWGADTCAYCVGMLIGKHKMTPVLSPKKSVEGAVGGILGAVLLGMLFAKLFSQPVWIYGIICFFGALISIVGDLAASAIKRDKGLKDYGNLIPGHGGIMDRFDSLILTAPMIYLLSLLIL